MVGAFYGQLRDQLQWRFGPVLNVAVAVARLSESLWNDRTALSIIQASEVHATDGVLHQHAFQ